MTTEQDRQQERRQSRILKSELEAVIKTDWPCVDTFASGFSMADFWMLLAKLNARVGLFCQRMADYAALKRNQAEERSRGGEENKK